MKITAIGLAVLGMCGLCAAGDARDAVVRIYLPRGVKADGDELTLGAVAVVVCSEAALARKARELPMGRAPWPKETIVINRKTILSRLAAQGIDKDRVRLAGADQVAVTRDEKIIAPSRLLEAAERFLHSTRPAGEECIYHLVRRPQEIVVPGRRDLTYRCRLDRGAPAGCVRIAVGVCRGEKQLGLREVLYRRMHPIRKAVAVKTVPAGGALTKENVEIQTTYAAQPAPGKWKPPYGLLATRRLLPGTVVRGNLAAPKRPDIVVRRNQTVRLRVQGPGFLITGVGQALQDGRPGEYIKVRNVDSRRIITGRIAFDGSVEPAIGR